MLPSTARPNDIVEVINEEHTYYGTIGKIINKSKKEDEELVMVEIYGKPVTLRRSDLKIRARVGTNSHKELKQKMEEMVPKNLIAEDYNDLINLAIDLKEWDWAMELVERNNTKKRR